ncbi:MAG: 4Fe-4S binding protein [Eubacterium sp.]
MAFTITEKCIGCTACTKKCPVMAIAGERKKPHQINEKRCVSCGVCQNVCPKGAILDSDGHMNEKIPKEAWVKPVFDREACSACGICADICIFDALAISYPTFKGDLNVYAYLKDDTKCVGCRQCALVCPLNVIKMEVKP